MEKNKLRKNFIWNMIGSTINAFMSLFLMILVTRINGLDQAGVFTFAFSLSCLLQVIGVFSGRAYQVTERDKKITDSDFIRNKTLTCFMMLLVSFIYLGFHHYDLSKNLIIILLVFYKLLEAFAEVFYGIIQKNGDLYKVGISLSLKSVISILLFAIINIVTKNLIFAIFSIVFTQILILVLYDIRNANKYLVKTKANKSHVLLIMRGGVTIFIVTLLTQYVINAPKYAIDSLSTNEIQTIYGIIAMPATIIILIGQFLIHPFLTKLSLLLKQKKMREFHQVIFKMLVCIFLIGVVADFVAYLIGIPFLELVYGVSLSKYKIDLLIIISGASFYGMAYILSNALITMRDNTSQMIIFILVSILSYFVSRYFVMKSALQGASLSYLISMGILLLFYFVYYIIKKKRFER